MVNKKINLNDSSGQQWKVKVSEVNGSFVFGEGWSSFSLGLGLKVGYLLVFNYIKDLHFDVKIYDTSACEKLGFSKKRDQKKRSRGKIVSPVRDGILVRQEPNAPKMKRQCSEVDLDLPQNSKESGQLMHISDHCEDPCNSKSLEFDQSHGDDGTMKIENGDLKVSNVDYESNIFEKDAMTCSKDTMFEGIFSTEVALDISELEKSGRSVSLGEAETSRYGKTSNLKIEENKAILSNMEAQECQFSKGLGTKVNRVASFSFLETFVIGSDTYCPIKIYLSYTLLVLQASRFSLVMHAMISYILVLCIALFSES